MDLKIRRLQPNEWFEFKQIRLAALLDSPTAFASSYEQTAEDTDEKWRSYLEDSVSGEKSLLLVADIEGEVAGVAGAIFSNRPKTMHVAHIFGVFVLPEYRNKGIGKKLIKEVIAQAKELHPELIKIGLDVNPDQIHAVKLYAKCGFRKSGTQHKELYINGKYFDLDIMELFL